MAKSDVAPARVNPFVMAAEAPVDERSSRQALDADPVLGERVSAPGPARPLHLPESIDAEGSAAPIAGPLTVLGLHGGAGTSTVSALLMGKAPADVQVVDGGRWVPGDTLAVRGLVVVARTHAVGLGALERFAQAWSHGAAVSGDGTSVLGAVVINDGPRPPKPMLRQLKQVTGMLPKTWRLPWVEHWRMEPPTDDGDGVPVRIRLTLNDIHKQFGK